MKKVLLLSVLLLTPLLLTGCYKTTVNGEHTGQVTAVESTGVIWKTNDVFFKSDAQSSQEDIYCVEDNDVMEQLVTYSKNKNTVSVKYHSELVVAPWRCNESTIIDKVELIK